MSEGHCLYSEYRSALRSYVQRRIRGADDVDDIVQEAFLRLHARKGTDQIEAPLRYLFRVVANLLADRGRNGRSVAKMVDLDAVDESWLSVAPAQENHRRLADLRTAYDNALSELPPRCRQAFVLRRHHGATTPEIAATLLISPRMVQKHMVRAVGHLQQRLHHCG